jgi:formyltetrahydrofolate synthetase
MPGLPNLPAAEKIDIDSKENIKGFFKVDGFRNDER